MTIKVCIKIMLFVLITGILHCNGVQGRISTSMKEGLNLEEPKIRPSGDGEPHPGLSHAQLDFTATASNKYFGAEGFMSLNNPQVEPEQSSWSFVSVEAGDKGYGNYSVIQGGWGVSPQVFGDSKTHFIAYWSSYTDGKDAGGCFNDDCRGFVHTNKAFPLNFATTHISMYEGDRFDMQVTIRRDYVSKKWWLIFHNITLGYWSNDVVPHLTNGADRISFGGVTTKSPDGNSPPMGFGKFPDDSLVHSGYFLTLLAFTKEGTRINPSQPVVIVDHPHCYNIYPRKRPEDDEYGFTYEGPGGACFA